jgi:hypothetical protein
VICASADNANKLSAPRATDAESAVSLDIGAWGRLVYLFTSNLVFATS